MTGSRQRHSIWNLIGVALVVGVLVLGAMTPAMGADPKAPPTCRGKTATIWGTNGNDTLRGTRNADVIAGLGGNDMIYGGDGNDLICGGIGGDIINGGNGRDRVYGEAGNDTIFGRGHGDQLNGGGGHDVIYGGDGPDTMWGMRGDDLLDGEAPSNGASGGLGLDTCLNASDLDNSCEPYWLHWDLAEVGTGYNDMYDYFTTYLDINGAEYYQSIEGRAFSYTEADDFHWWEYNLGRDYRKFVATIGIEDNAQDTAVPVRFEVYGDGTPIFSKVVTFGQSFKIRVNVTNVLRLRIQVVPTTNPVDDLSAVWASPIVSANPRIRPYPPTGN